MPLSWLRCGDLATDKYIRVANMLSSLVVVTRPFVECALNGLNGLMMTVALGLWFLVLMGYHELIAVNLHLCVVTGKAIVHN